MNLKSNINFFIFLTLCLVSCCLLSFGCSREDLVEDGSGGQDAGHAATETGKMDISFELDCVGSGMGTESSPLPVSGTDTLSLTVVQSSRYQDASGKVHTCEPVATVRAYAMLDTVYVSDVSDLSAVTATPDVEFAMSGDDPVSHTLRQNFRLGRQSLCYDMTYEVYHVQETSGTVLEMPYVRPGEVSLAEASAEGPESAAPSYSGGIRSITVTPLASFRAIVSDTSWYSVTVRSLLPLEAVHADSVAPREVILEHEYVGAVVRDLKVPNPQTGSLRYTLTHEGGTGAGTASDPGVIGCGESLTLTISEQSVYTEVDGTVVERAPQATLKFHAAKDTVYASSVEALTMESAHPVKQTTQTGDTLLRQMTNWKLSAGGQSFYFDLEHQICRYTTKDGETLDMPYVVFSDPSWGNPGVTASEGKRVKVARSAITVKPLPTTRAIVKDTVLYEVSATINVDIETVKTEEENEQTLVFVSKYIGAVVTETEVPDPEPKLVKVEYRTGYEWEEAHDNLPLLYYAHVYRDRYYDNGEVVSDFFVNGGQMWAGTATLGPTNMNADYDDGTTGTCYEYYIVSNDSIFNGYSTLIVPDIDKLSSKILKDDDAWSTSLPDEWDKYVEAKRYNDEFVTVDNSLCSQGWEKSDRPTGWYFKDCAWFRRISLYYGETFTRRYDMMPRWYEQYLVIDGLRIDFIDWRPELTYSFTHEDIPETSATPRCRVYKYQCHAKYYNRNFYINVIDSVMERR